MNLLSVSLVALLQITVLFIWIYQWTRFHSRLFMTDQMSQLHKDPFSIHPHPIQYHIGNCQSYTPTVNIVNSTFTNSTHCDGILNAHNSSFNIINNAYTNNQGGAICVWVCIVILHCIAYFNLPTSFLLQPCRIQWWLMQ